MHMLANGPLSAEEAAELQKVETSGATAVHIYRDGAYSEPDFVRFGVLQRLEIRRLLVSQGLSRRTGEMSYAFSLPETEAARIAA